MKATPTSLQSAERDTLKQLLIQIEIQTVRIIAYESEFCSEMLGFHVGHLPTQSQVRFSLITGMVFPSTDEFFVVSLKRPQAFSRPIQGRLETIII